MIADYRSRSNKLPLEKNNELIKTMKRCRSHDPPFGLYSIQVQSKVLRHLLNYGDSLRFLLSVKILSNPLRTGHE